MSTGDKRFKVILFDYYGVLVTPLHYGVMGYEWDCGLPKEFLFKILRQSGDDNSIVHRLLCGKITMGQYCNELTQQAIQQAKESNTVLPKNFSIKRIVAECIDDLKMNKEIIAVMAHLQRSGYKICILRNSWIDDTNVIDSPISCKITLFLKGLADYYFESAQIGLVRPSSNSYSYVMKAINIQASEILSIEELESSAKIAQSLGITTIVATENRVILHELGKLTEINLFQQTKPWSCNEDNIVHGEITTKQGIKIHFVEKGTGPIILFCHGFLDFWFGWRYQIPYFAAIGFRVIAVDHRGVGKTSCPPDVEDYSVDLIAEDLIELMDKLDIHQAILIGHDIGGDLVWNCCLHYPDRVRAVASLNFPYLPPHPQMNLLNYVKRHPSPLQYYLYFAEKGQFEKHLGKDIRISFQTIYTATDDGVEGALDVGEFNLLDTEFSLEAKVLDGYERTCFMTQEELDYYVRTFQVTGFTYSLNRFRNADKCWRWQMKAHGKKIYQPALFIGSDKESFLAKSICANMHNLIPNLTCLRLNCGHWLHVERPQEVNEALDKWLQKIGAFDHQSSIFV